eukprot:c20421_g1_i3.p1 GENE.c20421_g1_i3~~c20421_g1_i3.p1  ORF type:complete len:788 (-),score=152.73 c20421_g1_i3:113-2476(-)
MASHEMANSLESDFLSHIPDFNLDTPTLNAISNQTQSNALEVYTPQMSLLQPQTPRQASMAELQATLNAFMANMDQRMSNLENSVYYIRKVVDEQSTLASDLRNVMQYIVMSQQNPAIQQTEPLPMAMMNGPVPSVADATAPTTPISTEPALSLRFRDITPKWFTERTYPPFFVDVIDNSTGEIYRKTGEWEMSITLLDGNGNPMDEKSGDFPVRLVQINEGVAEVTGLKFSVVSSKHGNYFTLEAQIVKPAWVMANVHKQQSENLIILSCRLFHNPKRPLGELSADDQLSKMPGIGRLYAERFASYGVSTIRQLASIPQGIDGRPARLALLNHLRRDKGTMTENKLEEYIEKALDIVRKTDLNQFSLPSSPPTKKQKVGYAPTTPAPSTYDVDDFINYNEQPTQPITPMQVPTVAPGYDLSIADQSQWSLTDTNNALRSVSSSDAGSCCLPDLSVGPNGKVGASAGTIRPNINFPLHNAVATNDVDLVRNVIGAMREGNLPIDEENGSGWTPLMVAASMGNAKIVELLCSISEVNPGAQSSTNGMTALHYAACQGHSRCVQVLLRQPKADAGVLNKAQYTPLMMAVVKGQTATVEILSKIADSYRPITAPGIGLYHLAALSGNLDALKMVHQGLRTYAFANPSLDNTYGSLVWSIRDDKPGVPSILHCAAYVGSCEVIQWLLEQGVKLDVVNQEGWTPLHFAAYRGYVDCLALLASDKNINAHTMHGWTPLSLAAMNPTQNSAATVEQLLALGARDGGNIPNNLNTELPLPLEASGLPDSSPIPIA